MNNGFCYTSIMVIIWTSLCVLAEETPINDRPAPVVPNKWQIPRQYDGMTNSQAVSNRSLIDSVQQVVIHYGVTHRDEDDQELQTFINMSGRKKSLEFIPSLQAIVDNNVISKNIRAGAMKCIYDVEKNKKYLINYLRNNDVSLGAVALDILAQVVNDAELDELIGTFRCNEKPSFQDVVYQINAMRDTRDRISNAKNLGDQIHVVLSNIPALCVDTPMSDKPWCISDNAYSQYILKEFRRLYQSDRTALDNALDLYVDSAPQWKPLVDVLREDLKATDSKQSDK